jgi:hypothetical protein
MFNDELSIYKSQKFLAISKYICCCNIMGDQMNFTPGNGAPSCAAAPGPVRECPPPERLLPENSTLGLDSLGWSLPRWKVPEGAGSG